jgi:hypothetical protein
MQQSDHARRYSQEPGAPFNHGQSILSVEPNVMVLQELLHFGVDLTGGALR